MKKLNKTTKVAVAMGAGAVAIASTGVAYAYLSGSATGSTTGSAGTANSTATVSPFGNATAVTGLVPGGAAVNTTVTIKNTNSFTVNYGAKTVSVSSVTGPTNCADNTVALLTGSGTLSAGQLAPGGTTTVTVPVAMQDSDSVNQTACNNASFTVTYAVS